jgi:hypothetical protein
MHSYAIPALLLFAAAVTTAQDTRDFTAKYGPPELEVYQVTPDVRLAVSFDRNHAACRVVLEPRAERESRTMPSSLVDEIITQFVSPEDRKGEPKGMMSATGCAAMRSEIYDNVRIFRSINMCAPADRNVTSLTVEWQGSDCPARWSADKRFLNNSVRE